MMIKMKKYILILLPYLSFVVCQGYSGKMLQSINLILCFLLVAILSITEHPSDQVVTTGGVAYFTCRYSTPLPLTTSLSWYKDGILLSSDLHQSSTLVLSKVTSRDNGRYYCRVTTDIGSLQSRHAALSVLDRKRKPEISHRPVQTRVVRGDKIVLDCLASGYPPPTYAWYKDGGRLSSAHDRFNLASNGSLIIDNAQLDDSAHYRCSASNYLGKASSSARVTVDTDEPPRAPVITTRPRNVRVTEGGIIEMTCVAEGSPYPDISWWNNNRIVSPNSRVTVSNTGQHLRIQDIEVYDAGEYTCLAENRIGRQTVTATISVVSDGNILPQGFSRFSNSQGSSFLSSSSHRFRPVSPSTTTTTTASTIISTIDTHDMSGTLGSTVQLPCHHEDMIQPFISWQKDGVLMTGGGRYRFGSDGSLVIYNVSDADSGSYQCTANNGRERRTVRTRFDVLQLDQDQDHDHNIQNQQPDPGLSLERGYSAHTGLPPRDHDYHDDDDRYDTDLSYDVRGQYAGDQFVARAVAEAQRTVDRALNHTVNILFQNQRHTNRTPAELLNIFRFPSESERELARAGEIYLRTLELVQAKVQEGGHYNLSTFSVSKLISPANLELIGNLSGCETVRRFGDCEDLCFHSKYRSIDGSCNNHVNGLWGSSLTPLRRVLPPIYENGFNTPVGHDADKLYNGFKKPNARLVSRTLVASQRNDLDPDLSQMVMQVQPRIHTFIFNE